MAVGATGTAAITFDKFDVINNLCNIIFSTGINEQVINSVMNTA